MPWDGHSQIYEFNIRISGHLMSAHLKIRPKVSSYFFLVLETSKTLDFRRGKKSPFFFHRYSVAVMF
jgi:hypothetical protein